MPKGGTGSSDARVTADCRRVRSDKLVALATFGRFDP